jgi:Flp pilus assembly protein TadG
MRGIFRYLQRFYGAAPDKGGAPKPGVLLGRLLRREHGVVAVIVALAAALLIGFAALGVETGLWYVIERQNQSATDAAALSGA